MHHIKDIFLLQCDRYSDLIPDLLKFRCNCCKIFVLLLNIHDHDHVEHAGEYRLRNILNVRVMMGERRADAGDDADGIVTDVSP